MSGQGGLHINEKEEKSAFSSVDSSQITSDKVQDVETKVNINEEEDEECKENGVASARLEPSTLPWPGDLGKKFKPQEFEAIPQETDTSLDNQANTKWRNSMPEGEKWRDNLPEVHPEGKGDCSFADDEEEVEYGEKKLGGNPAQDFTPHVTIMHASGKALAEERDEEMKLPADYNQSDHFYNGEWYEDDKIYLCEHMCNQKVGLVVSTLTAGLLFPLLVWGGYVLLPFDSPRLDSPSLKVVYTLRCSFFASIPIVLGVLVQGVTRLRFSAMDPLYQHEQMDRQVMVHWHYINESMALFLFYFLQLAVLATYISPDLMKLVPLLTIVFVFGRLIYWLCLALDSSLRGFGFGFSFFPVLAMLGANLYFVCTSTGQGSVFDIGTLTTTP